MIILFPVTDQFLSEPRDEFSRVRHRFEFHPLAVGLSNGDLPEIQRPAKGRLMDIDMIDEGIWGLIEVLEGKTGL